MFHHGYNYNCVCIVSLSYDTSLQVAMHSTSFMFHYISRDHPTAHELWMPLFWYPVDDDQVQPVKHFPWKGVALQSSIPVVVSLSQSHSRAASTGWPGGPVRTGSASCLKLLDISLVPRFVALCTKQLNNWAHDPCAAGWMNIMNIMIGKSTAVNNISTAR